MADRLLRYRIGATDDASAVLDKVARSSKRAMESVQKDLEDGADSAEVFARAIEAMAEEVESETAGARAATDRMAAALGDDLAGAADEVVDRMRQAGLSFEEIENNADRLAGAFKRLDGAAQSAGGGIKRSMDEADDSVRRMGSDSDQSMSVLANAAGNTTQDLSALAGVAGTSGMALGQLAEYATEGGISLRNLAKTAGPMALITVAAIGISGAMQKSARAAELAKERTDGFRRALMEGGDAADYFREQLQDTGRIEFELPTGDIGDAASAISDAGLSVDQFGRLVEQGEPAIRAWVEAQRAAGNESAAVDVAAMAALDSIESYSDGVDAAATTTRLLGRSEEWLAEQLEETNRQLDLNRQRNDEAREAQMRRLETELGAIDSVLTLRDAERERISAIEDAINAIDDQETAIDEVAAANDRALQSILAEADAVVDAAQAHYGGALTVEQATALQIQSLDRVRQTLEPGSPLHAALTDYINRLNNEIPQSIETELRLRLNPNFGTDTVPLPALPGSKLHTGGVVPGPLGADRLIVAAGGETVRTPAQERQLSTGGVVINIDARGADRDGLNDAVWDLKRSLAALTTRGDA